MSTAKTSNSTTSASALHQERDTRSNAEHGPALLFFSGGTALKKFTRTLTRYTHNSIHVLTPFDSGGSSAALRNSFGMPAVGDVRSRLMALADQSLKGNTEAYALANFRFSSAQTKEEHEKFLSELIAGTHLLIKQVPEPLKKTITFQLSRFKQAMPADFDLSGASIGNLILAGNFLGETHQLNDTIAQFAELLGVQGEVRSVCDAPYHLAVKLKNGDTLLGQHRFTGKETQPISSPIEKIWLTKSIDNSQAAYTELCTTTKEIIASAALICYPPGSFYSSLIANLLPTGVGRAIAESSRPKVYVPNLGQDPEQYGLSLEQQVDILLSYLSKDDLGMSTHSAKSTSEKPTNHPNEAHNPYLNYILVDQLTSTGLDKDTIARWSENGIQLLSKDLLSDTNPERYDDEKLCQALLSLAKH